MNKKKEITSFGRINRVPYWINDRGEIIATDPLDHSLYAIEHYKKQGITLNPEQAVKRLVNDGWIRTQVFPDKGAFIQGTVEALKKNGRNILVIVPDLSYLEIGYIPFNYNDPPMFTRKQIDSMSWSELIDRARGR